MKLTQKCMRGRRIDTIIADFAGTIGDKYSRGPHVALSQTFLKDFKIPVSPETIRKPTGNDKLIHIEEILRDKSVIKKWVNLYGRKPNNNSAKDVFKKYEMRQTTLLQGLEYTRLLPNTLDVLNDLRVKYNMKYGMTTGYNARMMVPVLESLKNQGFVPDSCFASNEISRPRPYPDGILKNLASLKRYSKNTIKIGDTPIDMQEGNNAGCVTVGLVKYCNAMGHFTDELVSIFGSQRAFDQWGIGYHTALATARKQLANAGADFVVDTIEDLEKVIIFINN